MKELIVFSGNKGLELHCPDRESFVMLHMILKKYKAKIVDIKKDNGFNFKHIMVDEINNDK